MDLQLWLAFVGASLVILFVPGPTVLLVLSYALSHGKRAAFATVAGVALGDFIAMTTSLAGLGALILASAEMFTILKWIGALYLLYLGYRMLKAKPEALVEETGLPVKGIFGHAAAVTALNPKSIAFFIAFVPQFMRAEDPLMPQFVILIATFVTLAAMNAFMMAVLGHRLRDFLSGPKVNAWLSRMGGGALVAMGVATAFTSRANS